MILVVFEHSMGPVNTLWYPFRESVTMFHMPLYFFLSGMFFKTYGFFTTFLKNKVNKLLIPFLFFHCIFVLLVLVTPSSTDFKWSLFWEFLLPGKNPHNVALWFLPCLFILNVIFYIVYIFSERMRHMIVIIGITSFLIGLGGYIMGVYHVHLPLKIETAMTAMPFFAAGFLIRKYTTILTVKIRPLLLLLMAVLFLFYTYVVSGYAWYSANDYHVNAFSLNTGGLAGILFILSLSKMIGHFPLVSYWGRYSIMILVTHLPVVFYTSRFILKYVGMDRWFLAPLSATLLVMFSYLIIIPFMKKYLPYVTAQKDLI